MTWTKEESMALGSKMIQRAMTDEDFRRKLLADPNGTLEELAGKPLPAGYRLKVLENDPAYTATYVLPDLVKKEEKQ